MPYTSKYYYTGSPFIPLYDVDSISDSVMGDINEGIPPTVAICFEMIDMMSFHIENNLVPEQSKIVSNFGTTTVDLKLLTLGYRYLFDTILATEIYIMINSKNQAVKDLFKPDSLSPGVLLYIQHIREHLDITRDLLSRDITGVLVLKYLLEKPFTKDDYFETGHEFASSIFPEISLEVAKRIGKKLFT